MSSTAPAPGRARPPQPLVALLGQRDQPTDGVRDYCACLARALERRGVSLVEAEVPWAERGWSRALLALWKKSAGWRGRWVILQYTTLGWSRRGFPFGVLAALWLLHRRGARLAMVFHSFQPQLGDRPIDRLRAACQLWVMQRASRRAARIILPLPPERTSWLRSRSDRARAASIPIGANFPAGPAEPVPRPEEEGRPAAVAVFGVTGAPHSGREVEEIAWAVRRAKQRVPRLRLLVFGRGSSEAQPLLERALRGSEVELEALGILPAEEVVRTLANADVFLFVRGELSPNRGSAIAAISCGLPVVAYGRPDTCFPLSEAGVLLVPRGRAEDLGEALADVLSDGNLRTELRERSRKALRDHFRWEHIAERYLEVLDRD